MTASKAKLEVCPSCGGMASRTVACTECGREGCVEKCNPGGQGAPCAACDETREKVEGE